MMPRRHHFLYGIFCAVLLCLLLFPVSSRSGADAPSYAGGANWAYYEDDEKKTADVFLVAPTVALGENGVLNAAVEDDAYRGRLAGALNMQRGIYDARACLFAPVYRQATLAAYKQDEQTRRAALDKAYADVREAFLHYVKSRPHRPLVLAGFSQGAELVLRLLKEFFVQQDFQKRLAAAYVIGWRVTGEDLAAFPHLKMARGECDTGVIVSFNSEAEHISSTLFVPRGMKSFAVNPLNWKTDATPAGRECNRGACFTDYSGVIVREIPALTGAYLDAERGTLKVTDISERDYPGVLFEDGVYHLYDYQFFYRNLQENAAKRIAAYLASRPHDGCPEKSKTSPP